MIQCVPGDKVAFYVTGQDGQGNVIAMGGSPVAEHPINQYCGIDPEIFSQNGMIHSRGM